MFNTPQTTASELSLSLKNVESTLELLNEGATIPLSPVITKNPQDGSMRYN